MDEIQSDKNYDARNVEGFGFEWLAFDQSDVQGAEYDELFDRYFAIFPLDTLPKGAEGFDVGCGSGRWADRVASAVGRLHCIEISDDALEVAKSRLKAHDNVEYHVASIGDLPLADGSQDFGYSLGVLHHIPDPAQALRECVRKLKPGAPFLAYIYYRLDGRPWWYRGLFHVSEMFRKFISRLPFTLRRVVAEILAGLVYWPLARASRALATREVDCSNIPLSSYASASFYTMRTDSLNRFGTAFVKRYSRREIERMMADAGLVDIRFRERVPKWVAIGRRRDTAEPTPARLGVADRPLKVVHVINSLGVGGAEALLYRLVKQLDRVDHSVISLKGPDWYSARLEALGVRVDHLDMRSPLTALRRVPQLVRLIRYSGADVVQTWMYLSNLCGGLAAKYCAKPVVWGIHHSVLDTLKFATRSVALTGGRLASRVPDYVVNCSIRSAELHAAAGYAAAPGGIIHNGYDSEEFHPDAASRARVRAGFGIGDDTFVVGSITRWHPEKDVPALFQAVAIALSRGVPLRCMVLGNGLDPTNAAFTAAMTDPASRAAILPLGRRSDVVELARAMDVHVLSSRGEAFPNVVAETLLSGTPNIVTDVGDAALMVGDAGWVVPPAHPQALADAIVGAYREWSESKTAWEQRRQAGRARIADEFGFQRMADGYEAVWRRVAKGSHSERTGAADADA